MKRVSEIGGHVISITRTRGRLSACGDTHTVGDWCPDCSRIHDGARVGAGAQADEVKREMHSAGSVPRTSDRRPRQSRGLETYYSSTAYHPTACAVLAGKAELMIETTHKFRCCTPARQLCEPWRSARRLLALAREKKRLCQTTWRRSGKKTGDEGFQCSARHRLSVGDIPTAVAATPAWLWTR
jgi:hypothetical protein